MARKAFKYKLYRSDQNRRLDARRRIAAEIWNHSIALHKRYDRRFGKHLKSGRLKSRLAFLRNTLKPGWKLLGSQAVQDVAERIERSDQLFFKACRPPSGRKVRPPSFKKSRSYRSFTLKQAGWAYPGGNRVIVDGSTYKFHLSRPLVGVIKTVTIGRDAVGDFWVTFSVVTGGDAPSRTALGRTTGLDFGLKRRLTGADGTVFESPQPLKAALATMRKAGRAVSRKQKGSRGRCQARIQLAREHRRVAHQWMDAHHQVARRLALSYDVVCLEDLNLAAMKRLWGRKVSDLGFGQFVTILEHHCAKQGAALVKVGRFFPSSKRCSDCGHIHAGLSLRDRHWRCPACGAVHDRDVNAAKNIEREGLRLHAQAGGASSAEGDRVRPASAGTGR